MDLRTLDDVAHTVAQLAILNANEAKNDSSLREHLWISCENAAAMAYAVAVTGGCVSFSTIRRVYTGLGKRVHADVEELTAIHAAHRLLLGHRIEVLVARKRDGAMVHVYGADLDMQPNDPLSMTCDSGRWGQFDAAVFHGMHLIPRSYYESAEIVSVPIAFTL